MTHPLSIFDPKWQMRAKNEGEEQYFEAKTNKTFKETTFQQ